MSVSFWGDTERNRFEAGGELEVQTGQHPDHLPKPGDRIPVLFFNASTRSAPMNSRVTSVDPQARSYRVQRSSE